MSQHLKAHLEHIISESNPWTALRMNRFFSTGTLLYTIVAAGIDISPPQVVPQDASRAINPAFAGFAFEEVSFHYFSGDKTNPNRVSQNLVKAITDKTQSRPNIRVGGSSLDLSTYHPEQKAPIIIPGGGGGPDGIPKNIEIGPSYMESFANFDAQYVVDIPLAKENLNNSLLFIDHAYEAVGAENLYALEIGNEPNNYPGNVRPDDWSREEYVTQWRDWTARISGELGFEENSKVWQAIGLAPGTGKPGFPPKAPGDWTVQEIFENGMNEDVERIKSVTVHYYQTKAHRDSSMQDDLMNHTAVIEGTTFIRDAVEYLWNEHRIPLVVAEVGSALGNESSNASLEAILGSALWQVDFSLYCMSINVAGINMQSGINFLFSLWRPKIEEKPGVILPAFYGQIFTAEFVGAGSNVQVANMDLKTDFGSAYAAYENGKLARIAIVNLNLWSRSEDGDDSRPFETFSLSVGSEVKSVKVKKLTSPKGGSATPNDQITWGGMQWTYDNKGIGKQIVDDTEVLPVKNGQVDIKVNESEAVIVSLQR